MVLITGLTGDLWPAHPHRQSDELLSSWFVRTAHANGHKVQAFGTRIFGKRAFVWTRDLDRCGTSDMIRQLERQTGVKADQLAGGMLTAYEGAVFDRHNSFGNTQWILPSVFYVHRRRRYGMQFCPLCLFFDKKPYFRRRWRMAFSTICDVHGTMLHDRCPECSSPVIFFRNDTGNNYRYYLNDLVSCWKCGFDLSRAPARAPAGPDGKTIMALRSLVSFHDLGWWFHGKVPIQYGPLYFEVLHRLAQFLASPNGQGMLAAIEQETGWGIELKRDRKRCEFESRPIEYRHRMLMAILWLLDEWPDRFLSVARTAGTTYAQIHDGTPLPYWFESVIRGNLRGHYYHLTEPEIRAASAYLKQSGKQVSVDAVCKLLGRKNAYNVRRHIKPMSAKPFDDDEIKRIFCHYDVLHASLQGTARPRLVWQRDRVILSLMQLTGWDYRKLRRLSIDDAACLPAEAAGLVKTYLANTRSHMACKMSGDALFIKWKGGVLTGESWRCRFQHYKRLLTTLTDTLDAHCDEQAIKGCNVPYRTLTDPKPPDDM